MWAAYNGQVEVARLLLDASADKAQGWMEPESFQKAACAWDKCNNYRHEARM